MLTDTRFIPIGNEKDVVEGVLFGLRVAEVPVLLVRLEGRIYALGRMCTRQYVDLADGKIEDGCVVCPLHGSKFDLVTGAALTLPAIEPEPVYNVKVDGVVYVAVADSGHDFTKECHPCP